MAATEHAVGAVGEQFYVTHCATADSTMVRASSVTDADALDAASHYPRYELPTEMQKDQPSVTHTPRRLARTEHPDGGVWVVHSACLEKDTANRERSSFSHLLHLPTEAADPVAVLESWDASGWVKSPPTGASKTLPRIGLPAGRAISKGMLLAFLSRPKTGATDLSFVVCPARFQSDVAARRDLVARFLQALTLVTAQKDAGGSRNRLFVHAEPGLVAMLLYAAAHILPSRFTADLTFSTFEPAHRALREYKLATVVGTYLGAPGRALDPALATEHGYVLDALEPTRSSPELSGWVEIPAEITELVDHAANGQWDQLAKLHQRLSTPTPTTKSPTTESTPPNRRAASVWADKRVQVGAVAVVCGVLLLAVVALAVRGPKREPNRTEGESVAAPVAPVSAPPPAVKPAGTNPIAPKTADASGPAKLPDPTPPAGEQNPAEENPALLAETVGLLAGLQLYQSYLNIGLLADARAEGLYEAAELTQLLGSVMTPLEKIEKQLEKVAALKSLTEEDARAVGRMQKVASLLREQGKSLQSFWDTGLAEHGKKYEETRQTAWKELSDLLELDPKPDEKKP